MTHCALKIHFGFVLSFSGDVRVSERTEFAGIDNVVRQVYIRFTHYRQTDKVP